MKKCSVKKTAQSNGYHEVHREDCSRLPKESDQKDLGYHNDCESAVKEAKKTYGKSDGCYYCSESCNNH